jgi:cytoskeletal protein RodZ
VSIGDTLAQARSQAGLTITQVSQRTCIRETIVRGIEHDDFSACGGDFYARGHIRSIARVVGIDSEPLIHEYDATHGAPEAIRAADVFEPSTPIKLRERRSLNWSVAMIIVLALVVGYGVYRAVTAMASPHHTAAASQPNSQPTAAPAGHSSPSPSAAPTMSGTRLSSG